MCKSRVITDMESSLLSKQLPSPSYVSIPSLVSRQLDSNWDIVGKHSCAACSAVQDTARTERGGATRVNSGRACAHTLHGAISLRINCIEPLRPELEIILHVLV